MNCCLLFSVPSLDIVHYVLIGSSLVFAVLWLFSRADRFDADFKNIILESERERLFEILACPTPFKEGDIGKEFFIHSILHNGIIVIEGDLGYMENLRFVPIKNEDIALQNLKSGEKRVFHGTFNGKGECEIPNFLAVET
jgi:hypothetical protein